MYHEKDSDKANLKSKKFKLTLLHAGILLLLLSLITAIICSTLQQKIIEDREVKQRTELTNMQAQITAELSTVATDLIHFSHSALAIASLSWQDAIAKDYLTSLMSSISSLQENYDQIRLFDRQGNEIIRMDQDLDLSLLQVPHNKLQNKSNSYYLQNAMALQPDQIYISKFDLNKENDLIEYPIKPTLRFVTPIHSKDGELLGAGAINYNGKKLLRMLSNLNLQKGASFFLFNNDGYYLKGDEVNKEWGFMYPQKEHTRLSVEQPDLWQQMTSQDTGKVITAQGENYYSRFSLSPDPSFNVVNEESIFLMMHIPNSIISNENAQFTQVPLIGFTFTALIFILLGWRLANYRVEQERLLSKLKFEAGHDPLTGLSNRKEIITYLKKNISAAHRRNDALSLAYIDINYLKKTNDLYGHDAGDQLITGVSTVIIQTIREADYAARLGGDEFLIVFTGCDKENATVILQRIQTKYAELGMTKAGRKWSLSYGCTELLSTEDTAKEMIERADKAMYQHKSDLKQSVKQE